MTLAMTCLAYDQGTIAGAVRGIDLLQFLSCRLLGYLFRICMGGLQLVSKMIARIESNLQVAKDFHRLR